MFFDDHPEFLETSSTAANLSRLNMRHLGIITENQDVLRGQRVIDIASHDGRWSFAALDAGARHVTGIEGRQELVDNAVTTFRSKGIGDDRFAFVQGDVHDVLLEEGLRADVVMCLGFLYHTARYVELFKGIRRTRAKHVIIDSRVLVGVEGAMVEIRKERTGHQALAMRDRFAMKRRVISAVPTEEALVVMLDVAGYDVERRTDWTALLAQHPDATNVPQYLSGRRVTFLAGAVAGSEYAGQPLISRTRSATATSRRRWGSVDSGPSIRSSFATR